MRAQVTELQHDAFARATLMRHTMRAPIRPDPCKWCGEPKGRFIYFWEKDDNPGGARRAAMIQNGYQEDLLFCSVGCWRAYYL